jgi:hypothetical protein
MLQTAGNVNPRAWAQFAVEDGLQPEEDETFVQQRDTLEVGILTLAGILDQDESLLDFQNAKKLINMGIDQAEVLAPKIVEFVNQVGPQELKREAGTTY